MNVKTVYYKDFSGGLNDTTNKRFIKRHQSSLLRNWDITFAAKLVRRDGLTQLGNTQDSAISGLHSYLRKAGAGKDILIVEDTNLKYLNSTTFATLDSGFVTGHDMAFATVTYNDKVYIGNEDNTIHVWDRAATTLNGCLTDLGADVPHGNKLIWHKNHMFTANNATVTGTQYPNRIYWSAFGDPETWDTTNDFIELPGGGRIINLIDWGNVLVILKEHSIMYLTGWGDSDWRVSASASNITNIDEAVGTASHKGATRVGDEVWFIDDEAQVRRLYKTDFDAYRRDIISTNIQGTLSGINKARLGQAVMWTYNDKVYVSVSTGSETKNTLILVYDIIASKRTGDEAWVPYTGWSIDFADTYPTSTTPDLILASGYTKKVYKHTGDDDDGVAIDARWDSLEDDYGDPDVYKRYRFGRVTGEATTSDVNVGFYASVDDADFAHIGDLSLASVGGTLGPTGTFELGPTGTTAILSGPATGSLDFLYSDGGGKVTGRTMIHSIRHNVVDEQPTVYGFTSRYKPKSL